MNNFIKLILILPLLSCGVKKELQSVQEKNTQLSEKVEKLEQEKIQLRKKNESLYQEIQNCRRDAARLKRENNRLNQNKGRTSSSSDEQIFTIVENMPRYPGGEKELYSFIARNIRYPETARNNGIEGKVYVKFVVEKDGRISNVKVLRGIDEACNKEAIRVTKLLQNWIPGTQRGKAVRTSMILPFSFKLN